MTAKAKSKAAAKAKNEAEEATKKKEEAKQKEEVLQVNLDEDNVMKKQCALTENPEDDTFKSLMAAANIWIGDTGTSFHVRGKKAKPERLSENPAPPTLHTALGITTVAVQSSRKHVSSPPRRKPCRH